MAKDTELNPVTATTTIAFADGTSSGRHTLEMKTEMGPGGYPGRLQCQCAQCNHQHGVPVLLHGLPGCHLIGSVLLG